jgi:membrane-associated phospholipid phosphatase
VLKTIRDNKVYFTCLGLYFFIGAILLMIWAKGQPEIFLNRRHNVAFDLIFQMITFLGDGFFAIPLIIIIFLFQSMLRGIIMTASVLTSFLIVQSLKLFVFPEVPRPLGYFPEFYKLYYVEGLKIHSYNSFPSGHSAQAFAIFLLLAIFFENKKLSVLFFLLALLTTISRMYLLQHFFLDTYFGALIATVVTFVVYISINDHSALAKKERLQKGWLA